MSFVGIDMIRTLSARGAIERRPLASPCGAEETDVVTIPPVTTSDSSARAKRPVDRDLLEDDFIKVDVPFG